MKQFLAIFATILALNAASPKPAHAVVGGVMALAGGAGVPLLVVGGSMVGGGILLAAVVGNDCSDHICLPKTAGFLGLLAALSGIVILDDGAQTLQFAELSPEQGQKLGISDESLASYNDEIAEVNAVCDQIGSLLAKGEKPTIQDSQRFWAEYKNSLSPGTFEAVQKISANMFAKAK